MKSSASRETILKNIRQALNTAVPVPFPEHAHPKDFFEKPAEDETVMFAEAFSALQGKFSFCENTEELKESLNRLFTQMQWNKIYCSDEKIQTLTGVEDAYPNLEDCDVSITGCEYLIARTGTMVLTSRSAFGRTSSVYAPIHICIAYSHQIVYDLKDALHFLKEKYQQQIPSFITFASGPSRTADIEKTLVTGIHGPKEVYCFLIDS
jgi:L-lactate dehydrogenase complex protein LldG